jgi:hypothetical protein
MADKPKRQTRQAQFRFDIRVNGKRICLAGTRRYGTLSMAITRIRRDPRKRPSSKTMEKWEREILELRIGALTGASQENWDKVGLKRGDEVTISVLGAGSSEAPDQRYRAVKLKAEGN